MKEQRKTEIKVGLTVLIGILLFIWILGWAENLSIKSTQNLLKIKFKNVSGLEVGDPVTINGLRKGYVNNIIMKDNELIVEAAIDNKIKLQDDARFSIVMLDLMGGKKIDIYPGNSQINLDFNKTYSGDFQADIPSVIALFGSVQDDLVTVLKDVKAVLSSINHVISDDNFTQKLKELVNNVNLLANQINKLVVENKSDLRELTQNTIQLTENTNNLIQDNKESLKEMIHNFNELSKQSKELVDKINSFADEINKKDNNLGKILYDEELLNNLKSSVKQLETLTRILVEQLNQKGLK
jgi:phospholipid/cholesterol/gamma-HCH transport system substrate-binding protein